MSHMWPDADAEDTHTHNDVAPPSAHAPSCKNAKCKDGKAKKCVKRRTKIGAHVEKKLRKNMQAQVTALFEEHLGKTRETKSLIEAITKLCLAERQKAVDAQMRQIDVFFNFLAVIQKEIDFIKSGQRRVVGKKVNSKKAYGEGAQERYIRHTKRGSVFHADK